MFFMKYLDIFPWNIMACFDEKSWFIFPWNIMIYFHETLWYVSMKHHDIYFHKTLWYISMKHDISMKHHCMFRWNIMIYIFMKNYDMFRWSIPYARNIGLRFAGFAAAGVRRFIQIQTNCLLCLSTLTNSCKAHRFFWFLKFIFTFQLRQWREDEEDKSAFC